MAWQCNFSNDLPFTSSDNLLMSVGSLFTFQYFGLKEDQVPLIVLQQNDGVKYLNPNLEPDQIIPWLKDYKVFSLSTFLIRQLPKCFGHRNLCSFICL
jgi:hypothetical protein